MRTKEEANDYRYFPCPDLLPVVLDGAYVDHLREILPELPDEKRARFQAELGLSAYDAGVLAASREMAEYFEEVKDTCGDAKQAANWVMGELAGTLNREGLPVKDSPVSARQLGGLIGMVLDDNINGKAAKQVFQALWNGQGQSAAEVIEAKGLKQVTDSGAIGAMVDQVSADSPAHVAQYRHGERDERGKIVVCG